MGKSFQTVSMKDLIEIVQGLAGGVSDDRLAEMLGEITKKILEENDPDTFDEEKKKAYSAKVRADKSYAERCQSWEDMCDGDWQPIEKQVVERLRTGETKVSYSVALKEQPLLMLLTSICQVYHRSDFDGMLKKVLSELNRLDYDIQEQEERLCGKRYTYKEFFGTK